MDWQQVLNDFSEQKSIEASYRSDYPKFGASPIPYFDWEQPIWFCAPSAIDNSLMT
jgi:hypothetical protein